ncbi:coiled-coil domain-containing protein 39-like [Anguilla rostrata]|uniref:coiled-coil domain-containing protein 39-like n=1 Tax=Anguilla rostrata TaxID=7938 RepID=UPI0030CB0D0B
MSSIVFSEIGWDQGFAFPVANAENKALEEELQGKQKDREEVKNEISEHKDRIQAISAFLKNVKQELSHTQALCVALGKEAESEVHFKAVADRELGHLEQEIVKLDKEMDVLKIRKEAQENDISRANEKMGKLMSQLNWDKVTLEAWLEESAQKDEDTIAILKYVQQDKCKIKELIHAVDNSTVEANQKHKTLETEHTRTITVQIGLEKTLESLRKAHVERQALIRQWESTIEQMRKRDHDLQQCIMLLPEMHQEVRYRQDTIKERKMFLERQLDNNAECERKGLNVKRLATKLRGEFQKREGDRARVLDEFVSLRVTVERMATDVEAKRSQLGSIKKDIHSKHTKMNAIKLQNEALGEKLQAVTETVLSADERATQMEQMLKEEEQNKSEIEAHVHRLRMAQPHVTQELQAQTAREKVMLADIAASRVALNTLIIERNRAEQTSLKQQEMINGKDFQIQLLERKMVCAKVEENSLERQVLRTEEIKLVQSAEQEKKTVHMLGHHLKRLQVEISIVKKVSEKNESEKKDLTVKSEELNLVNDTCIKELKKLRSIKQDTMVDSYILKLEVHRLSTILQNKADRVLSLEKEKLQLQAAMKEGEAEVNVHKEMLQKQFKMVEQERQALSLEMNDKLLKMDKLRKRYEIMILSMESPDGEGWSPEYYLIKIEKEKEELQRMGNELDAKIYKKEEEIQALENTLYGIYMRNVEYRRAFNNIAKWSKEHQQQLRLEKEKTIAEEKTAHRRLQVRERQEDIRGMNATLENLLKEETEQLESREKIQFQIDCLKKDLGNQKVKLGRVSKQCSKLSREIRSNNDSQGKTDEEQDIEVRELKDFSKQVNSMLQEAIKENPDLSSALERQFQEANVPLPAALSRSPSQQCSRTVSIRNSTSVRSSVSAGSNSLRSSAKQFPHLKKVDLGLQLNVTSPRDSNMSPRSCKRDCSSSGSINSQP